MKIADVPLKNRVGKTRARVLEYLEEHRDEVFRIRQCEEVAQALDAPQRTVEHALWSLQRDGLISKANFDRDIWYGSHAAIEELISLHPNTVRL
jgi:predicted ArsR family transcriptional regulator